MNKARGLACVKLSFLFVALILAALSQAHAHAQAEVVIAPVEKWTNVFGGGQHTLNFKGSTPGARPIRAGWTLSIEGRVLSRGEVVVASKDREEFEAAVPVNVPPVKDGVVLPLDLKISLLSTDNKTVAETGKRLWVYPSEAFSGRQEWLKNLNVRLFDPVGVTTRRFEDAKIPFRMLGNADALAEGEPAIAVIGEGVSFDEYRELFGAMIKAAAGGHAVLCLAPVAGTFVLPGSQDAESDRPAQLRLADASAITYLDNRLDAVAWSHGSPVASTLALKVARNQVAVEVNREGAGWSWLESTFSHGSTLGHGKLVVCGFGIVSHWDDNPTPRYLIARILEYLYDARSEKPAH